MKFLLFSIILSYISQDFHNHDKNILGKWEYQYSYIDIPDSIFSRKNVSYLPSIIHFMTDTTGFTSRLDTKYHLISRGKQFNHFMSISLLEDTNHYLISFPVGILQKVNGKESISVTHYSGFEDDIGKEFEYSIIKLTNDSMLVSTRQLYMINERKLDVIHMYKKLE